MACTLNCPAGLFTDKSEITEYDLKGSSILLQLLLPKTESWKKKIGDVQAKMPVVYTIFKNGIAAHIFS